MASEGKKLLADKTALITGGSRGIGRAIAASYMREGARVFICARDADRLQTTLCELRADRGVVDGLAGDIGTAEDARRIARTALERFGSVDVLVNNASLLGPREPIMQYPLSAWDEVIRVNLTGLFLITQEILPTMMAQRAGSIINVTSGVGRVGKARWGAYAVSKAGVEGFTQVLADEVKDSAIRVNAVNPAATRTEMRAAAYPQEDPGTLPLPEQVTPLFVYLASDAAANVTGKSLNVRDWPGIFN